MILSLDHRESGLIRALGNFQHKVKTLAVGDLMCEYENGSMWIGERKCANDLAKSITTGHWREQVGRLHASGCRIFYLIEGDLRNQCAWYTITILFSVMMQLLVQVVHHNDEQRGL